MTPLVEVDRISETGWNSLLPEFSDASLYQTWAYGAVSWGEGQISHVVLREENRVIAAAQLRVVRFPILGGGVAHLRWGPFCVRKGGEWDEGVFRQAVRALVAEYVERRRLLLRIVPKPFAHEPTGIKSREVFSELGLTIDEGVKPYRTFRLDLAPSLEQLRNSLDQKWRNQLNGAERNNLEIAEGTSDDLFAQFIELYTEMMSRKGFETTVDPAEFRRVQARLPQDQKMLILISRKDGRPMTGLIGFACGESGIYLLGATSNEGLKTKGSYLLQWKFVQHLKKAGCRWYDLGGANPEANPGVYHFKQGLGGEEAIGLPRMCLTADSISAVGLKGAEALRSLVSRAKKSVRRAGGGVPAQ